MKSLVFTVTNDITYDQRMHRICLSLAQAGYRVAIIGRQQIHSVPLHAKPYHQHRLSCWAQRGKLFYIEYNMRLLFYLLFHKADGVCPVDLDTVLPSYLISKMKGIPLVFDAHEHFTEMIEVVSRPAVKKAWLGLEKFIFPRLKHAYTVSENLKNIFNQKYGLNFQLIRNVAQLEPFDPVVKQEKYIVYAGAVNHGRGLNEFIEAMPQIDCKLIICGKGDLFSTLQHKVNLMQLQHKVIFKGYVSPHELTNYIRRATLGCLLLENMGLSYYYSLANKFFDYMHAGIPQVTINFPEYEYINKDYKVAELIPLSVQDIVAATNRLLHDDDYYRQMCQNALSASEAFNWQKEEKKLIALYQSVFK